MALMSYSRLKLCVVKFWHRGEEMTDRQKLLANEQMDCSRAGLAQASPLVPIAVVAPMAPMASMVPMALMVPEAVTALLAPKLTIGNPPAAFAAGSHTKRN